MTTIGSVSQGSSIDVLYNNFVNSANPVTFNSVGFANGRTSPRNHTWSADEVAHYVQSSASAGRLSSGRFGAVSTKLGELAGDLSRIRKGNTKGKFKISVARFFNKNGFTKALGVFLGVGLGIMPAIWAAGQYEMSHNKRAEGLLRRSQAQLNGIIQRRAVHNLTADLKVSAYKSLQGWTKLHNRKAPSVRRVINRLYEDLVKKNKGALTLSNSTVVERRLLAFAVDVLEDREHLRLEGTDLQRLRSIISMKAFEGLKSVEIDEQTLNVETLKADLQRAEREILN